MNSGLKIVTMLGIGINISKYQSSGAQALTGDFESAVHAYSFRELDGYSGPVARIRRSSDNVEADFKANEFTDGTLLTWIGAGNGYLTVWYNQQTSVGGNVLQTTAGSQGFVVISGALITLGGLPAVRSQTGIAPFETVTEGVKNYETSSIQCDITQLVSARIEKPQSSGNRVLELHYQFPTNGIRGIIYVLDANNRHRRYINGNLGQSDPGYVYTNTHCLFRNCLRLTDNTTTTSGRADYSIDADGLVSTGTVVCATTNIPASPSRLTMFTVPNPTGDTWINEIIHIPSFFGGNQTAIMTNMNTYYSIY